MSKLFIFSRLKLIRKSVKVDCSLELELLIAGVYIRKKETLKCLLLHISKMPGTFFVHVLNFLFDISIEQMTSSVLQIYSQIFKPSRNVLIALFITYMSYNHSLQCFLLRIGPIVILTEFCRHSLILR